MALVVQVGPGPLGLEGLAEARKLGGDDLLAAAHRLQLQTRLRPGAVMAMARPLQGEAVQVGHVDGGHRGQVLAQLTAGEGYPARCQVMAGDQPPKLAGHQDGDAEGGLHPHVLQILDVRGVDGAQLRVGEIDLQARGGGEHRHRLGADVRNEALALDQIEAPRVGGHVTGGKVQPQIALDPGPEDLGHHLAVPAGKELVEHNPVVAGDPRDRAHQGLGGRLRVVHHRQLMHPPRQQLVPGAEGRGLAGLHFHQVKIAGQVHGGDHRPSIQMQGPQPRIGQHGLALVLGLPPKKILRQGPAPVLTQQTPGLPPQPVVGVGGDGGDAARAPVDGQQATAGLDAVGQVQIGRLAVTKGGVDHRQSRGKGAEGRRGRRTRRLGDDIPPGPFQSG